MLAILEYWTQKQTKPKYIQRYEDIQNNKRKSKKKSVGNDINTLHHISVFIYVSHIMLLSNRHLFINWFIAL